MMENNVMTLAELEHCIESLKLNDFHKNHLLSLHQAKQHDRIASYLEGVQLSSEDNTKVQPSELLGIIAPISEAAHQLAEASGAPRGVQVLMSYPFFSISKNKRIEPIEYNDGNVRVKVLPGIEDGMAKIWDADILWWLVLQLIAKRNEGESAERIILFKPYELLKYLGKPTGGVNYQRLKDSLRRLQSTTIRCNLKGENKKLEANFHWLDDIEMVERDNNKLMAVRVSTWLYRLAIQPQEILKLSDDYFKISKGLERWLYLLARKHAGKQRKGYSFRMRGLYERSAARTQYKYFAKEIRRIASRNQLPEYHVIIFRDKKSQEHVSLVPRVETLKR